MFFIAVLGGFAYLNLKDTNNHGKGINLTAGTVVNNDLVCMVNDTYMGKKQLLVPVDNKDYYGCCEMCVERLQNNVGNVRYATDPQTQEQVDKATAFIVLKSNQGDAVWYFKSQENYQKFKEGNN